MTTALELRHVALRVPDLARSLEFYVGQLGFTATPRSSDTAELSVAADAPVALTLVEDRSAPPAPANAAGLFHAAFLFPTRDALGAWLHRTAQRGTEFDGFSDHGVSEAIYFSDPDGNGLEFYADRPSGVWPHSGRDIAMVTQPLDVTSLLTAGIAFTGDPLAAARWGHLHLRVTDLDRSEAFYRAMLGVEVTQRNYPGARFLAADGYHHHLGLNTWGRPQLPEPPNALGLIEATFARHGTIETPAMRDPDGIAICVEPVEVTVP
jgi:catechol 2,3-dioxygenase